MSENADKEKQIMQSESKQQTEDQESFFGTTYEMEPSVPESKHQQKNKVLQY